MLALTLEQLQVMLALTLEQLQFSVKSNLLTIAIDHPFLLEP